MWAPVWTVSFTPSTPRRFLPRHPCRCQSRAAPTLRWLPPPRNLRFAEKFRPWLDQLSGSALAFRDADGGLAPQASRTPGPRGMPRPPSQRLDRRGRGARSPRVAGSRGETRLRSGAEELARQPGTSEPGPARCSPSHARPEQRGARGAQGSRACALAEPLAVPLPGSDCRAPPLGAGGAGFPVTILPVTRERFYHLRPFQVCPLGQTHTEGGVPPKDSRSPPRCPLS